MKFQFEPNQDYQLDAIAAVVDVFAGQQKTENAIVSGVDLAKQPTLELATARGNILALSGLRIAKNTHAIQKHFGLQTSSLAHDQHLNDGMNFSIEMETGTGKTYVYLRTIHELHSRYGWKKFIIVVPSVAIREGVLKNLEVTREHFADLYDNPEMKHYVWDSKKSGQAREFATSDTLQIMVITIDSFAKAENIMNKESDEGRPLDYIRTTNPIVIIDEPQNMETQLRRDAISSLHPLCTLRYSATHKHPYNMLYRLTPVDAYDKGLVKKIEVHSVLGEDSHNDAYISVQGIERSGKSKLFARLELDINDARGLQRKAVKVAPGDDLAHITKRSMYDGYIVEAIDSGDKAVEFSNGKILYVGQKDEALHEAILKRQIELTIEDHFEKQKRLAGKNVKVLSLFFIDKVENYRTYTDNGSQKGKFARWFEEAFEKIASKPKYAGVLEGLNASDTHDGYFAADKNGRWKDSKDTKGEGAKSKDDDSAYHLIMQKKEELLDDNTPLRFIFSHSALREGWDNPNVFTICTLNESSSEMKKRQEIGRGLRLPVNANGERVRDEAVNVLTVVANESYADFSRKLQTEIEDETGVSFSGRIKNHDDRTTITFQNNTSHDPTFQQLWAAINPKTTFAVTIDATRLVEQVVAQLAEVTISHPQVADIRTTIDTMSGGQFASRETSINTRAAHGPKTHVPNLLESIQGRTHATREIIFDILDRAGMFEYAPINPQQVIDEVSMAMNRVSQQLAVDGIVYTKTGDSYDIGLLKNGHFATYQYDPLAKSGAVRVARTDKTVYDHVAVDSEIEYTFMRALEANNDVKFYIKLPSWFKIDTPFGSYNPDWAIAFRDDTSHWFVVETKSSGSLHDDHIAGSQQAKIMAAKQHFAEIGVPFIAPVATLQDALARIQKG